MSYFYKVYGLSIESEMLIPELMILDIKERENIDVTIKFHNVKNKIKKSIDDGKIAEYNHTDMWFYIKNIAIYHIFNGDTVYIEPCKDTNYEIIKTYILGSVLGMVLLQRNIVAIHGGAVAIDGRGCIFTGGKGAGKSTITTSLRKQGYKFISDDVCSIADGVINKISPGFARHKLCEDTMMNLGYDISKFVSCTPDDKIKKYNVPLTDEFIDYEAPLEYIFEICVDDVDKVQIEEIIGESKLNSLIENIFKIEMIYYAGGITPTYFKKCVDIAKHVKYYKITRPRDIFSVEEQISLVEEILYT